MAIVVAVSLLVGAVAENEAKAEWVYDTPQNKAVVGNLWYLFYKRKARRDVVEVLHFNFFHWDANATLDFMKTMAMSEALKDDFTRNAMRLSGFWRFFFNSENGDFAGAARETAFTTRCLVMHYRNPIFPNRHNWTKRLSTDQHCTLGTGYIPD